MTDPTTGPYWRPVSATERLYLAAGDPRGDMALRIVVEGEGLPDPEDLRAALTRAAGSCPGSGLVAADGLWRAEGPPPRLRFAAPADPYDGVLDAAVLTGHTAPTDPPGCEVLVVPGLDPARCTLVFSASHALMDGHGALLWVREVFRGLRGDAARPAADPETDQGLLRRLGCRDRRPTQAPDHPSPLGRGERGEKGERGERGPERTLWLRRTLAGHHPALTARLAQALADATGRSARVMVPADLRRYDPDLAATGNLTLPLFLDLRPGTEWTVAHTELLTALAEGRECATGFESAAARLPQAVTALLLRAAQAVATRTDRHLATAVVSHLGRLDLHDYRGGGFTATAVHALPVHAPLVPLSLVAAETGAGSAGTARTEVTMGVRGGPGLAERAARLLDDTLARLTGPAATPAAFARPATPEVVLPLSVSPLSVSPRATDRTATAPRTAPDPAPGAAGPTVVDLFRARAARTPHAPALDGPEGPVTYAALDRRSDAVAAALHARGIGREDRVALVVDRSPAGVAALWGILKAGAAYLPLDPAHPDARIEEVLRDSGARLCLTQRHFLNRLDRLDRSARCPALAAEDVPDLPEGTPPPGPGPAAGDLAYVMHTSGSTGRPKGVQIEHAGLVGFVRWMTDLCRVTDTTRFGFVSSYAFDISCFPLFLPLLAGGTAVLAPGVPSRAVLRRLVTEHRADTLALTPSHLPLLTAGPGVRTLLLGGETLTPAAARAARAAFGPDCRIINGYGPTEATVACLAHVVGDDDLAEGATDVPLGTPGPYAHVALVAADGTRVGAGPDAVGRTGEIVVNGPQVARGYLVPPGAAPDDPGSPFTTEPDGTRGYRTGDLGRRLPDGSIAFAGRVDGQLKIAGHRVEPAETVAALESHPAVRRAVVTARRRTPTAAPVLCAYVVPRAPGPDRPGLPELAGLLRADAARRLPAHLVPAHLVLVEEIPSTVAGKADLDALPDPFTGHPTPPGPDDLRVRVAGHWAVVLGTDAGAALEPGADFQDLGGDSLSLIEMLTAVSSDLLTRAQADRFMGALESLVREVTLDQVCAHIEAAREEVSA
ncbi:amino acid adenylation domain-containing protein [Streptomyces sp. NPDC098789]|uniref:amino acid adenylation domain-containing protein n=1 Tax=Streptomyces sp. NPDC098789 TaxID=3366098 RepID=UPI00380356E7